MFALTPLQEKYRDVQQDLHCVFMSVIWKQHTTEEEETLFDPKSANVQCITYQI